MTEFLKLKKSNCKNCYKCIRHCPVKSIRFTGNSAHIVENECIWCGQCFVVCPQNAREIRDDLETAKTLLAQNEQVVVSLAPSFIANFDVSIASMEQALRSLGFAAVEETAVGATLVKTQYEQLLHENRQNVVISSCCHSVNLMIRKYYPEALPCLARVASPMQAHCLDLKRRYPQAKTLFIGPCISKKAEAEEYGGIVDCVLTFDELERWFQEANIRLEALLDDNRQTRARFFPTSGGILKTMHCDEPGYSYLTIDGLDDCMHALEDIIAGKLSNCFVEMSACSGSCIGGPVMSKHAHTPIRDYLAIEHAAGREDFPVQPLPEDRMRKNHTYINLAQQMPSEEAITEILKQMGKTKPDDELNCGTCGYNTCREKAIAVYQGKANLNMCLPFLLGKAESFSDNIIKCTPNAIIVLNEMLEVQQINDAACKLLNLRSPSDVLGEQVIRILDPTTFVDVLQTGRGVRDQRVYLAEYKKYVEQTVVYDRSYHILLCVMRDVSKEEISRVEKEKISQQTIEVADKVVEKQMRVVQEIASLLGETTAETKIALTRLKESMMDE